MKLLLDQNLSRRLLAGISGLFPGSSHVALLGLERASDVAIWEYAAAHGYAVVSKDSDFVELARRRGPPPKVIHIDVGNLGTDTVLTLLRDNFDEIVAFDEGDARLLVISRDPVR